MSARTEIQKLHIALFNRPADPDRLDRWEQDEVELVGITSTAFDLDTLLITNFSFQGFRI
ncbi:MAG TPA: hypothetical protein VEY95_17480 [Azospirillaceae bacterium]|nr:hypothetical protein [Azospirillaceae bacterium]